MPEITDDASANIDKKTDALERVSSGEFRDTISDKLRNPLVPIMSCIDMLIEGKFGNLTKKQNKQLEMIKQSTSLLNRNISDIIGVLTKFVMYYDKILTATVKNYALTGDKTWKEYYKTLEQDFSMIINDVIRKNNDDIRQSFLNMEKVNMKLVEMEYQAIDLIDAGKKDDAIALLESTEYLAMKKSIL